MADVTFSLDGRITGVILPHTNGATMRDHTKREGIPMAKSMTAAQQAALQMEVIRYEAEFGAAVRQRETLGRAVSALDHTSPAEAIIAASDAYLAFRPTFYRAMDAMDKARRALNAAERKRERVIGGIVTEIADAMGAK